MSNKFLDTYDRAQIMDLMIKHVDRINAWLKETTESVYVKNRSHDTANEFSIELKDESDETLTVWYNRVWKYSGYEFNDRDKVFGIQPNCEFAQNIITAIMEKTLKIEGEYEKEKREKAALDAKKEAELEKENLAHFKSVAQAINLN